MEWAACARPIPQPIKPGLSCLNIPVWSFPPASANYRGYDLSHKILNHNLIIRPKLSTLCFLPALAGLMLLMLSPTPAPAAAEEPVLLAVGDLRGEIKPCGCSPQGQMGGLPRRLSYLEGALAAGGQSTVLVDLGNNFPPPSPQGRLKVDLIQQMLARFPPDAILPGPNELALGLGALAKSLPYLVSNDEIGKSFQTQRTLLRAGIHIGLFGYLSPELVYQKSQQKFRLSPVSAGLLAGWRKISQAQGHQRRVLLFRGNDSELALVVRSGFFDAIVAGNPGSDEMNQVVERKAAGQRIAQVPTKGQGLLRMALTKAGAKSTPSATVDWLKGNFPDHADAKAPFEAYDRKVKALFFAKLETMKKQEAESPFLGAEACKDCHARPYAVWRTSRHATALPTLEKVGKRFDPECLVCHVVGMDVGGFLSKGLTPQLAGVQCENCHGPGRAHGLNPKANRTGFNTRRISGRRGGLAAGLTEKVGEATCRGCHMGSHSPAFDFKTYWPKILHSSSAAHDAR